MYVLWSDSGLCVVLAWFRGYVTYVSMHQGSTICVHAKANFYPIVTFFTCVLSVAGIYQGT